MQVRVLMMENGVPVNEIYFRVVSWYQNNCFNPVSLKSKIFKVRMATQEIFKKINFTICQRIKFGT